MYAKNYRKRSLFEKVMAKIKRCSFFAPQCIKRANINYSDNADVVMVSDLFAI